MSKRPIKRKSTDYSGANSGGWLNACTELFLARYRGQPCEICGKRVCFFEGRNTRSCGHHLIFQSKSRAHKFSHENILVLCAYHHCKFNPEMSPHSEVGTLSQGRFDRWVEINKPEQYRWWNEHEKDEFNRFEHPSARDLYVELGGEAESKSGNLSDLRPVNHAKNVILTIHRCGGVLTKDEQSKLDKWRK